MKESIALILYIPVIHRRYVEIIREWASAHELTCLYIVGEEMIKGSGVLTHEIRALDPQTVLDIIVRTGWLSLDHVDILTPQKIPAIRKYCTKIVTAREGLTMGIVGRCFPDMPVEYIDTFLRWDTTRVAATHQPDHHRVSTHPHHVRLMADAKDLGNRSSDWWRRVGAIIVDPATLSPIMSGRNEHMPSEYAPYIAGDPRDVIPAGTSPEISTAIHAEGSAIARAAASGLSTRGTYIFTSTFPCAACARLIVRAGISKVFYHEGHSNLDGDQLMRSANVEIIQVP
ncbi:MAG: hypothetical protein EXS68_01160 [Candidatus Ryanbacteria bacterium]|nr:hypothetical protein [Candidatus Ryanbacteria bacterium]